MFRAFCTPFTISCDDGTIEEVGVWIDFPAILPVGSEVLIAMDGVEDKWELRIESYTLDDGVIWVTVEYFDVDEGTTMAGVRELLIDSGWITFEQMRHEVAKAKGEKRDY